MLEILQRGMNIVDRIRGMEILSRSAIVLFGAILVFGAVNCILGYRLLRFWMMLFGFVLGAAGGLFAAWQFGVQEKIYYLAAAAVLGIAVAVIAFLSYKAGIFIIGAGLGLSLSIYVIHPTSSLTFFLCILAGVGLGVLALRYERGVIIVGTSLLGGVLAGFSTAKLLEKAEIPYGILLSVGYALAGMLVQFAINRPQYEDDGEEEEPREVRRTKRPRKPSGSRAYPEDDFDERTYRKIYESLDEEDIEEAYLREKVLNEDSPDPVEDFINEKIEDAREHRSKKRSAVSGKSKANPERRTARPRRNTASDGEEAGRTHKRARSGRNALQADGETVLEPTAQSKASRTGQILRQVDFNLTEEDEIAVAHRKAWEQKKKMK